MLWITSPLHRENALFIGFLVRKVIHIVIHCFHILASYNQIKYIAEAVHPGASHVSNPIERVE